MRLVDSKQMQEMDTYTIETVGLPSIALMENAARSWVESALPYLNENHAIYVFCGGGNNGGDGYAIARNLVSRGYDCIVISVKPPKSIDCIINARVWNHYGLTLEWKQFLDSDFSIDQKDVIIDAVLGTGLESELKGTLVEAVELIDKQPGFKIAVDVPSGISASTGDLMGVGILNDVTITFQKEKIGHHLYPGRKYSGKTICQNISILEKYHNNDREYCLLTGEQVRQYLPLRRPDSYKNQYGHLVTWCGTPGTLGASFLASYAALKVGTGLVTSALPEGLTHTFLAKAPELMSCLQNELSTNFLKKFDAAVIGCGLGREQDNWRNIESILREIELPVILDADAFYGIQSWDKLNLQNMVLTPHPGEFQKLTGYDKPRTNKERIEQGIKFIEKHKTTLVLKGAPTLVFTQEGKVYINSSGNSGMSTAGSGDVLSGIIGGFLAQGVKAENAALLGVWLHGKSGDEYITSHSEESLTAMSLVKYLDDALMGLK
ncbi:NAD(P)H-hydrate dehydratase [bacterium]|nr:NAD(P)H-hydrate dehydratase [bacterium]